MQVCAHKDEFLPSQCTQEILHHIAARFSILIGQKMLSHFLYVQQLRQGLY